MDVLKKAAALAAVDRIANDSIVGLGSGSTLDYAIQELGERVRDGRLKVVGVPTSYQSRFLALRYGIPLRDMMDVERLDLTIDGADEVDPHGNLIKGAGAAHVLEKIVAAAADRFIVVVDESKLVRQLGERCSFPVESVPPALSFVMRRLAELGAQPMLRSSSGKLGPVISDYGNPIIDSPFGPIADVTQLNHQLNNIPGVVGHGLFVGMADEVIVARSSPHQPIIETLSFQRIIAGV